jgi:ribose transport system substrate-binding protein
MNKQTSAITGLVIAGLLLSGCAAGSTPPSASGGTTVHLAGVSILASDPFFITLMCGATKEAAAEGATIDWKASQDFSPQSVSANLEAAALTSPAAILMTPDATLAPRITQLMQAGTPVVAVNAPIDPPITVFDVVSDTDSSTFAQYVAKDIGNSGSVAILAGIAGIPVLAERYKPLVDQLTKAAPNVKVLEPQFTELDRTKAAAATSALIIANPDLKAVYAVSGPEGAGAASAIAQAGKTGQIKVYTFDGTPEVIQAIKTGQISAALAQSPVTMGRDAVSKILAYLKAGNTGAVKRDESQNEKLPLLILTKDNVEDPKTVDYLYSSTCN